MDERGIFEKALDFSDPGERRAYVAEACGADDSLRERVDALLQSNKDAGSFLQGPAVTATEIRPINEKAGTHVGPYKLLQEIGEGGMGTVFMAEQLEPVRRKVALKVIKPGMDTRQVIARFEAERQALSLMDHPNIARVLDAGTTASGRPYFVMELVKGQPITQYCDEKHLTPRERLELLLPVCQAIQHAHQKGIIHRDIKPSNILVAEYDQHPVPKVIDFGVAKATSQPLTEKTMFTSLGQIVGTLEYMSPEQAKVNQLDIDTRSDVYSLGVLMYELLTGSTPFDKTRLRSAAWDEMLRIIREEEPPKPSLKLSSSETLPSVAANRKLEPARLSALVRGELDWIVMKALEKDRNRRYETANGLASDISRYLNDEPVQACPPSAGYRLAKFLRRHKGGVAAAASFLALLLLVSVGATSLYVRHVSNQQETAQQVRQSLGEARTAVEAGDLVLAGKRVAEAQGRLGDPRFAPLTTTKEVNQLAAEVEARRADRERFDTFCQLARDAEDKMGSGPAGRANGDHVAREVLGLFDILSDWHWVERVAKSYLTQEQRRQVEQTAYETLVTLADYRIRFEGTREETDADRVQSRQECLSLLDRAQSFHEPTRAFWFVRRQTHKLLEEIDTANQDDERFHTAEARYAIDYFLPGKTASSDGDFGEAIRCFQAALRIQPDHYNSLLWLASQLGSSKLNRLPESIMCFTGCIALRPYNLDLYISRARLHQKLGNFDDAEADLTAVIVAPAKPHYAKSKHTAYVGRAEVYRLMQKPDKEEADLTSAIAATDDLQNQSYASTLLAKLHQRLGQPDKARHDLDRMQELLRLAELNLGPAPYPLMDRSTDISQSLPAHMQLLEAKHNVAHMYWTLGELDEAVRLFEETFKRKEAGLGRSNPFTRMTMESLCLVYADAGKLDQAAPLYRETLELQKDLLGSDNPTTILTMLRLGTLLVQQQKFDEAEPILRECLACSEKTSPDSWLTFNRKSLLGGVLLEQVQSLKSTDPTTADMKLAESEALLLIGYEGLKARESEIPAGGKIRVVEALQRLVELYAEWGKPEEEAQWHKILSSPPDDAELCNDVAWLLATSRDRNMLKPERAVELAKKANDLRPATGKFWTTLGVAQYRTGDWPSAITALEKSQELLPGPENFNSLFLAMAHWQLDQKEQARKWYDQAVKRMDKNKPQDKELLRVRAEAAKLLDLESEAVESTPKS